MHYADRANILAVKLLLRQRRLSLPVDPFCLECGGKVVVDSVQHFSGVVGMKPQDFLCEQSEDCFAVLYRGRHFILYNRGVLSLSRRRWSIAHELGHICCRHQSDGPAQEAEANAFAASLLGAHGGGLRAAAARHHPPDAGSVRPVRPVDAGGAVPLGGTAASAISRFIFPSWS